MALNLKNSVICNKLMKICELSKNWQVMRCYANLKVQKQRLYLYKTDNYWLLGLLEGSDTKFMNTSTWIRV